MEFFLELAKTSLTVAVLAAGIYFLYRYFSKQVQEKDSFIREQLQHKDEIIKGQTEFIQKFSVDNVKMMSDFGKTLDHVMRLVESGDTENSQGKDLILRDIQNIRHEMNTKMGEILLAVKTRQ